MLPRPGTTEIKMDHYYYYFIISFTVYENMTVKKKKSIKLKYPSPIIKQLVPDLSSCWEISDQINYVRQLSHTWCRERTRLLCRIPAPPGSIFSQRGEAGGTQVGPEF